MIILPVPIPKEQQLWVQDFYTEKSNILNLYNQVSKKITEEINIVLTPQEENFLAETKTVNPDAYDAYLKGKYYWDQLTLDGLQKSLEYFNLSLEKDNEFAPAYSGIATTYIGLMQMGFTSPSIGIPKIYENTQKALELDPNYSDSHLTSAIMGVWTEWNWEKGESEFLKALELNPNDVMSHAYYAHLLMILLRSEEAFEHMTTAIELDPLNPLIQSLNGIVLYYKEDYESAIEMARKAISIVPNHTLAWRVLWLTYVAMGDSEKSLDAYMHLIPFDDVTKQGLLETYNEKGFKTAMEEITLVLEEKSQTSFIQPIWIGATYSSIGIYEKAIEWFEKAYETHDPDMPYIQCLPLYKQFNGEPAYDALVEKMKFK